jgi:hypothetical protein
LSLDHTPNNLLNPSVVDDLGKAVREAKDRRNGTDRRLAIAAQATPTGNGAIVLDEVLRKIDNWINNYNPARTAGLLALREDLCARAEVGLRKYGTKLRVNNGRRAVVDLYQELMDALMYSMQARMESAPSRATIASNYVELLLELSRQVAAELDAQ